MSLQPYNPRSASGKRMWTRKVITLKELMGVTCWNTWSLVKKISLEVRNRATLADTS